MFLKRPTLPRVVARDSSPNQVYFPPEDDDPSVSLHVHAGDLLNITWATTWSGVDLQIHATAPGTNFTPPHFYYPNLPSTHFFPYRLRVLEYYLNDTTTPAQAFFQLTQHGVNSEFVKTQNFTIKQAYHPDQLDDAGNPLDAATWTGSVTLTATGSGLIQPTIPPGASFGQVAATTSVPAGAASVAAASAASTSTTTAGASASASAGPPEGLSTGQRAGIGVGVALAALFILGIITIALVRRKSNKRAARQKSAVDAQQQALRKSNAMVGDSREPWYDPNRFAAPPDYVLPAEELPTNRHERGVDPGPGGFYQHEEEQPEGRLEMNASNPARELDGHFAPVELSGDD